LASGTACTHVSVLTSTTNAPGTVSKRFEGSRAPDFFSELALTTIHIAPGATELSLVRFPWKTKDSELSGPGAKERSTLGFADVA
jgi:hypothetical protein